MKLTRYVLAAGTFLGLAWGSTVASTQKGVTYLPADKVSAAFVTGMPLVEVENYKVHASRRDVAGQAEVHEKDTDIVHVLTGTATLVTGGSVIEPKTIAPEEIRGSGVQGGEARRLSPGDVLIVPNGVPHWFKEVPGPLTYYVVKVRAEEK
jgi:mannose-6-phosphate isomerase-like protein (cupin superfamily)